MNEWRCPYAIKKAQFQFLICSKQMTENVDYNIASNATRAFCGCQRRCNCSHEVVNTELAKKCFANLSKRG